MAQLTDDCFAFSGPLLPLSEMERLIGERVAQGDPLALADRRDALADQPLHCFQGKQRAGKGETVVGQLRHRQLLP